jgi:hypothetical protein
VRLLAGDWLRDWRRRWFELRGDKLTFSKGEGADPHGSIDLKLCLTVKSADEKCGKRHSFEVATASRVYFMYADTEKAKDEWIGAIGRAIVRYAASSGMAAEAPEEEGEEDESDYGDEDEVYGHRGGDL